MEKKNLSQIVVKSEYSRRFPDPLNQVTDQGPYNIEHHILLVRAIDVPAGIPKDPNPREQNIDRGIYRTIKESLESIEDQSFHLKNKGITILAHRVDISDDKKITTVYLGEGEGIADGAHTYEIILAAQREKTCPSSQYVKFEIITGAPKDMAVEITGGLNTAVQVQDASLLNLEGRFDWVRKALKGMPYEDKIAYKQNEDKDCDIRDILSYMAIFNKKLFPNGDTHPKVAYVSKAKCLELYDENQNSFEMLKPILKDILILVDYISIKGREKYNDAGGRAGAMKGVYNSKERTKFKFIFMGTEDHYKLYDGTLYPILGALRFLIEQKKGDTVYSWKLSSFEEVKKFYDWIAAKMITTTYNLSVTYNYKPNPIGKDENHWDNLYKTVALHYLETRQG